MRLTDLIETTELLDVTYARRSVQLRVLVDPTAQQVVGLLRRIIQTSPYRAVRALVEPTGRSYWWDAALADHESVHRALIRSGVEFHAPPQHPAHTVLYLIEPGTDSDIVPVGMSRFGSFWGSGLRRVMGVPLIRKLGQIRVEPLASPDRGRPVLEIGEELLYHGTGLDRALQAYADDQLNAATTEKRMGWTSLSRNPRAALRHAVDVVGRIGEVSPGVVFVLDARKLRSDFHVEPYTDFPFQRDPTERRFEAEERVRGDVRPLRRYLHGVILTEGARNVLENYSGQEYYDRADREYPKALAQQLLGLDHGPLRVTESIEEYDGVRCVVDPVMANLHHMLGKGPVRGIRLNGNDYIWDGHDGHHQQVWSAITGNYNLADYPECGYLIWRPRHGQEDQSEEIVGDWYNPATPGAYATRYPNIMVSAQENVRDGLVPRLRTQGLNEERSQLGWITTWTIPGRAKVISRPDAHHTPMARELAAKFKMDFSEHDEDSAFFAAGWIRGGFFPQYYRTKLSSIYMQFDEATATRVDVNRTLEYLRRVYKSHIGENPTSVWLENREVPLRAFPTVVSHLKEARDEFAGWFAGSKVVDANGNPLLVYRGDRPGRTRFTGTEDKSVLLPGNIFWTDSPKIGRFYTPGHRTAYMTDPASLDQSHGLYRAHLRVVRPLVVDAQDEDWSRIPVSKKISWSGRIQIDDLAAWAREHRYDGLIVRNVLDQAGPGTQYVVFDPDQVRLVPDVDLHESFGVSDGKAAFWVTPDGQLQEVRPISLGEFDHWDHHEPGYRRKKRFRDWEKNWHRWYEQDDPRGVRDNPDNYRAEQIIARVREGWVRMEIRLNSGDFPAHVEVEANSYDGARRAVRLIQKEPAIIHFDLIGPKGGRLGSKAGRISAKYFRRFVSGGLRPELDRLRWGHSLDLTEADSGSPYATLWGRLDQAPRSEGIEAAEAAWIGGVADHGDREAGHLVRQMPGYFDYQSHLHEVLRAAYGEQFPVYRLMDREQLSDWIHGRDVGPVATSLSRDSAERYAGFAAHQKRPRVLVRIEARPEDVLMLGSPGQSELVLDGNQIEFGQISVLAEIPA